MKIAVLPLTALVSATAFAGLFDKAPAVPAAPTAAATDAASSAAQSATGFAQLSSKIADEAKTLLSNPQITDAMKSQLTKLTDGVLHNKDGAAAEALNKIVALKPSDDQMGVVKELQSNLGALVLGRNFDANDPASGGAVKSTIDAIKAKDTASIVAGLQKLGGSAKLTDNQKQLVGNLLGSYNAKLAGAVESVGKAKEAIKGFGF